MVVRNPNRAGVQAALLLLILSSCTPGPGPFDSYVGVNLIADSALAFPSGSWIPDDATGVYMGFAAVSGTGYEPPSGHADAAVYRMEIKNLIPDGDFENVAVGTTPGGWTIQDNCTLPEIADPTMSVEASSPDNLMSGRVLHLTSSYSTDLFTFPLRNNTTYGVKDGFPAFGDYCLRFRYLTTTIGLVTEYGDMDNPGSLSLALWETLGGTNGDESTDPANDFKIVNAFPTAALLATPTASPPVISVAEGMSNPYLAFGAYNDYNANSRHAQEAYVDDLRMVRIDKTLHVRLKMAAQGIAAQDLVPGCYRFSVYVKRDPSVGGADGYNRFHAAAVGLTVKRTMGDVTVSAVKVHSDSQLWTEWVLLSVDLENISQDPDLAASSMDLSMISADDTGAIGMDCGSILVSVPRLEMYPDGF